MFLKIKSTFFLLFTLPIIVSWRTPKNDSLIVDRESNIVLERVGRFLQTHNTTAIAITIPIFNFGCSLLPTKVYSLFRLCLLSEERAFVQSNISRSIDYDAISILKKSASETSDTRSFSQNLMDSLDALQFSRMRRRRQTDPLSFGISLAALGLSTYNNRQNAAVQETQKQMLAQITADEKLIQSTVANLISLSDSQKTVVEVLNGTQHSMSVLKDRMSFLYEKVKEFEQSIHVIVQNYLPSLEKELRYTQIRRSIDDLANGKKNLDFLSTDELHHLTNTIYKQASTTLSSFDAPLTTVVSRLLANQAFYFVPNTDNRTNGNVQKDIRLSGNLPIYRLGTLIISNVFLLPKLSPSLPLYEVFNTPFFRNNNSFTTHNLPRYISFDYTNNRSLAWYMTDLSEQNCYFGSMTFCHVSPANLFGIEHPCLAKMIIGDTQPFCTYVESFSQAPYVRRIHDSTWVLSVKEETHCFIRHNLVQHDDNYLDKHQRKGIIVKDVAIVTLPCKAELLCMNGVSLSNSACSTAPIDFYLASDGNFVKNDEIVRLLQRFGKANDSLFIDFKNDANKLNSIAHNLDILSKQQHTLAKDVDMNIARLPSITSGLLSPKFDILILLAIVLTSNILIIIYVKFCAQKVTINVPLSSA